MYAIIQLGSLQYKVQEGDTIDVEYLEGKDGRSLHFEKVLLFDDGTNVKIGRPYLNEVKITAKVLRHHLADKVISYKYRRRKNSAWKKGHRQKLTQLSITKITTSS